ncbi:unnamed protein product [Leuciscus chuanchicus]
MVRLKREGESDSVPSAGASAGGSHSNAEDGSPCQTYLSIQSEGDEGTDDCLTLQLAQSVIRIVTIKEKLIIMNPSEVILNARYCGVRRPSPARQNLQRAAQTHEMTLDAACFEHRYESMWINRKEWQIRGGDLLPLFGCCYYSDFLTIKVQLLPKAYLSVL